MNLGTGRAAVTLVGGGSTNFDVTTGKTTWSVPMGACELLFKGEADPPIAGPTQVVLARPGGPVVLDFATGHVEPPARGATYWCMTSAEYEFSQPYTSRDGSTQYSRTGGAHAFICDEHGQPATALPSPAATSAAGARVGNHVVIATKDGYVGFKLRQERARERH